MYIANIIRVISEPYTANSWLQPENYQNEDLNQAVMNPCDSSLFVNSYHSVNIMSDIGLLYIVGMSFLFLIY